MVLAAGLLLGVFLAGSSVHAQIASEQLSLDDVEQIIARAATRAKKIDPKALIAIVDREGFVLGVWSVDGNANPDEYRVGGAIREAGTASYLSSDQNAFTSRTAQFIIQQNFPPGILNTPPGPLVGVAFSNLPYSDVNRFKRLDPLPGVQPGKPGSGFVADSLGTGIPHTRLSARSSSAPLYKNNVLVGGVGVFSAAEETFAEDLAQVLSVELKNQPAGRVVDEGVALAGQLGYEPSSAILATNVTINGIGLPYVLGEGKREPVLPLSETGVPVIGYSLHASPTQYVYQEEFLGGQNVEVRFPIKGDPTPGDIEGQPRLTADEVSGIIALCSARARITRSGIRLPAGVPMQAWITVVGNPNQNGVGAPILGIVRTPGATFFSFDVALQKARTAVFFSSDTRAFSSRTVGFLAQNYYPPGLEGRAPGPFGPEVPIIKPDGTKTLGLQDTYSLIKPDPNLPNGITVFPGGFPLYRNGVLIGGVGVSGDGVDQDDLVAASGVGTLFNAPETIHADQFTYDGARLPYAKFPRNPEN
jgi:uncharacterized protein GlcG (DUF336 family)